VSRSSFVKAEPLLKYGVRSSELPCVESVYNLRAVRSLKLRTVRLVSCTPEVDRGKCPNLLSFFCFMSVDILKLCCTPMRGTGVRVRESSVLIRATIKERCCRSIDCQ
jgi:hypothetical protein